MQKIIYFVIDSTEEIYDYYYTHEEAYQATIMLEEKFFPETYTIEPALWDEEKGDGEFLEYDKPYITDENLVFIIKEDSEAHTYQQKNRADAERLAETLLTKLN